MKYRQIVWGECPSDWENAKLGELVQKENRAYTPESGSIPTVCSISNTKGFTKSEEQFDKQVYSDELEGYSVVKKGEFGYNPSRINVGSIAQLKHQNEVLISPMYEVFSVDESRLSPAYFSHLINSPQMLSLFDAYSEGSVRQTLNFSNFSEIPVVLPPLSTQNEIVSVLDPINQSLSNIRKQRELTSQLKSNLFNAFISGELTGSETETRRLGPVERTVPQDWPTYKLGEISNVKRGASPRPIGEYMGDAVHWVKISDMSGTKYVENTKERLISEGKEESVFVESGTVILSISATVAEPAILGIDGCIHDGIVSFQNVIDDVLPEFLYYSLDGMKERLASKGQRAAGNQSNINSSIVKNSELVVPPVSEQKQIIQLLNKIDSWRSKETDKQQLWSDLYESVASDLLSGQVRKHARRV
ncbi:type I site-specific deoxyribonuclease subunit RmeS [Haloferax gibbonsii]|uniref:Type I site-specific deoxyribonuclease subunit RmeS n=1 Tax=Haloferax gibbonsii TaxID=35746 RepID=A0A871BBP7_HALGI|nr:restriction endonuclease subunit S [Haloferax gibbonsii]QOS10428.1 type I site-specific deoxyribonuclease subunit RmeS [Haloferax gibbonsii]